MATATILTACLDRLILFAASPGYTIAHPGIKFTPPSTGYWLEPQLFPNEPANYGWDDDARLTEIGFFQVLVMYRPGEGQVNATEIADAIIAYFPKGQILGPVRVYKRPHQSPPVVLSDKAYIPVTIPYRELVTTTAPTFSLTTDVLDVDGNTIQVG